jgi:hypothetical protein
LKRESIHSAAPMSGTPSIEPSSAQNPDPTTRALFSDRLIPASFLHRTSANHYSVFSSYSVSSSSTRCPGSAERYTRYQCYRTNRLIPSSSPLVDAHQAWCLVSRPQTQSCCRLRSRYYAVLCDLAIAHPQRRLNHVRCSCCWRWCRLAPGFPPLVSPVLVASIMSRRPAGAAQISYCVVVPLSTCVRPW